MSIAEHGREQDVSERRRTRAVESPDREASIPASVLALQRAAGNRAVVQLFGGPSPAGKRFFVEGQGPIEPERLGTGTTPLGQTKQEASKWPVPKVVLIEDAQGHCFAGASAAQKPESEYWIPAVGDFDMGEGWNADGDKLSKGTVTFSDVKPAPGSGTRRLTYRVTPAVQDGVRGAELQHVADFQRAFALSCGLVSTALEAMQGRHFTDREEAMRAFGAELTEIGADRGAHHAIKYLAPADPFSPDSWEQRIKWVADRLESASYFGRDKTTFHNVSGFEAVGDESSLRITPNIEPDHRPTEEIVNYTSRYAEQLDPDHYKGSLFEQVEPEDESGEDSASEPEEADPFADVNVSGW